MIRHAFAAATLLAAPALAQTAHAPPVVVDVRPSGEPVSSQRLTLGRELARVLNSEELTRRQTMKVLDDTLPKTLAADSNFIALEQLHPGIGQAFIDAMRPIIVEAGVAELPTLWDRLAPAYAETFSEAELDSLLAFYRSPVGMKIIRIMGEGADFSSLMGNALRDSDAPVTKEGLTAGLSVGIVKVQQQLTPAEIAEVVRFEQSPAGRKLPAATAKAQAIIVAWANEPSPEVNARIEAAVTDVVQRYVGAADEHPSGIQ